jgi:hypothetical protein
VSTTVLFDDYAHDPCGSIGGLDAILTLSNSVDFRKDKRGAGHFNVKVACSFCIFAYNLDG